MGQCVHRKWTKPKHGQQSCTRCGRVRNVRRVRLVMPHWHRWYRKRGDSVMRCRKCPATRAARR